MFLLNIIVGFLIEQILNKLLKYIITLITRLLVDKKNIIIRRKIYAIMYCLPNNKILPTEKYLLDTFKLNVTNR